MPQPSIEVLGVYRLSITEALLQEQAAILSISTRECKEQLESIALIEVLIKNRDAQFKCGDFTQRQVGVSRENWQAAWAEAYLSVDGEALVVDRWNAPPQVDDFRCTFFLHFYQPGKPLITSYGECKCPAIDEMPERLSRLVPFEPVD